MSHLTEFSQAPRASGRRRIEKSDIEFAAARRPHVGWQALAKMLGVNEADLRGCVERHAPPAIITPAPPAPAAAAAATPVLAKGTLEHRVLRLLAAGFTDPREAARIIERSPARLSMIRAALRRKRLISGYVDIVITPLGHAELARLAALESAA
ncbi:MAG TPA: hypothetical protein VGH15_05695 [Caulobacteraceae bacterium]